MRGWLGVWSRGIDVLAERANSELGVEATSLSAQEWRTVARRIKNAGAAKHPIVLIGHSLGGDDQIRVAKLLHAANIPVDLMVLIDPNLPPSIPPNVKRCVNIFKSQPLRDVVPVFRGVRVHAVDARRTRIENIDLRKAELGFESGPIDHFNIASVRAVQDMALAEIAQTCPRRER